MNGLKVLFVMLTESDQDLMSKFQKTLGAEYDFLGVRGAKQAVAKISESDVIIIPKDGFKAVFNQILGELDGIDRSVSIIYISVSKIGLTTQVDPSPEVVAEQLRNVQRHKQAML